MAKVKWIIWIGVFFLIFGISGLVYKPKPFFGLEYPGQKTAAKVNLAFGSLLVFIGLIIALGPGGILRKEQVVDNWSIMIEDAQGKADFIFNHTDYFIEESKAPKIKVRKEKIAPSFLRGIFGGKRDFLIITKKGNPRLKPYQLFLNVRDYGNNLDVAWYLTFRPSFLRSLLTIIPFVNLIPKAGLELDIFDLQDLRAYGTNAHHCLLKAVEKLMLDLNQDPSKIDRKTRGFLGIS